MIELRVVVLRSIDGTSASQLAPWTHDIASWWLRVAGRSENSQGSVEQTFLLPWRVCPYFRGYPLNL